MLAIREIEAQEFKKKLYQSYRKDFPRIERTPYYKIRKGSEKGIIHILVLEDEENILAYALNIEYENYVLIYYLATVEANRGKGYGTQFLNLMQVYYQKREGLFIEVERQGYGKDEKENQIRQKRIEFYRRNGFKEIDLVANIYCTDYEIYLLELHTHKDNYINQEEIIRIERNIYYLLFGTKSKKHVMIQKKMKKETNCS